MGQSLDLLLQLALFKMPELLKDQFFNPSIYNKLTNLVVKHFPKVNSQKFIEELSNGMEELELNDRVLKGATTLTLFLGKDLDNTLEGLSKTSREFIGEYSGMIFPKYVEICRDVNNLKTSFQALEIFTQYSSAEFAIRYFLKEFPEETLQQMDTWSKSKNEHVRRLSSEGLRPLLPWSFNLTKYLNYPEVSFKILTRLNNDDSLYVRKSIGNHLNDLTKFATKEVLDLIKGWNKSQIHTSWIIKKGLRTLIKDGNIEVFDYYGYTSPKKIKTSHFELSEQPIKIGEDKQLMLTLENTGTPQNIILDYQIEYLKQNGTYTNKVFKWKETELAKGKTTFTKSISFRKLSTRKLHTGKHYISIKINGVDYPKLEFILE